MKIWKRCLSALLALIMLFTSANVGFAAGRLDGETNIWSATAADIVAEHYGLTSNAKIAAVLSNGAIRSGAEYAVAAPHVNGTEGKQDLIAVDYRNKAFYVKSYETEGYLWIPTAAVLLADGEEKETFNLTESVCYYNNVEYYATEAFTYDGKHYTIEVTYELAVSIDSAEQQRIMEIPAYLVQTAKNIEKTLSGMWYDLYTFNGMVPALYSLLNLSLPADEAAGKEAEPFFDKTAHAAEIAAIEALYAECMKAETPPQLEMFLVCDESLKTSDSGLVYAMEEGEKVKNTAAALYEKLEVLAKSQRLNSLTSRFKAYDAAQGTSLSIELKNLYRYLDRFVGTAGKDGSLELLKDEANWAILDPDVQESIFKEDYDPQEFAALESAVSGLRNVNYTVPEAQDEVITAVQVTIPCEIITHDVTVSLSAQVVAGGDENVALENLTSVTETFRMLDGASQEEVDTTIRAMGLEDSALSVWNGKSEAYKINAANYQRTQTTMEEALHEDLSYEISYVPNYYSVKTNYGGSMDVPFGYRLKLPVCDEEDGWYDYNVIFENGNKISYDEGTVFAVESNIEVARIKGAAKFEYRILEYLANDPQYFMSDEEKAILSNAALKSPVVRLRIPGENISEIIDVEGGFYIEAKNLASGMSGMTWNLDSVTLYDSTNKVQDVEVSGGRAAWETAGFTHVVANHSMQVTRVREGIGSRKLEASEIAEYANLPHVLVNEICQQDRVLRGTDGVTAYTMLEQMKSREGLMGLLPNFGELMETTEGKNAILLLSGSESANIKGVNGESLGRGGWSSTSDEPAIYKYLKLCENAGWSVATYYQKNYDKSLATQSKLMADCLEIIVEDPGFIEVLDLFGMADKAQEIEEMIPELRELSEKMKGPNKYLDLSHPQLSTLIADVLAAEGQTRERENATTVYAYYDVRRNGENSGTLQAIVQLDNVEKTLNIDYDLETVDGSERYHIMTAEEATELQQFIAASEAACGLTAAEKQYYDLFGNVDIPVENSHLGREVNVSLLYSPKTYTVTISGVSTDAFFASFQYNKGNSYVIDLPAKSNDAKAKTYYEYTFLDEKGEVLDTVSVENGSEGHFSFKKAQLTKLFPGGGYVIYRQEKKVTGVPELTFKPKLSNELIRGAEVDEKNNILYLDAVPTGIDAKTFKEQVITEVENAKLTDFRLHDKHGRLLNDSDYVGTGATVYYVLEDVFKKKTTEEFVVIMMGDVSGDGICDENDVNMITGIYFLPVDKKGNYTVPFPLTAEEALAANMNNNKKIDSNDAWTILSKGLYWNADKKQNQIVYRTVL